MRRNSSNEAGHYGRHAYRSDQLPRQKLPPPGANPAVPWFNQQVDRKLPWGGTRDVAPQSIRRRHRPESLRRREGNPRPFGDMESHQKIDHECYRHATAALRTRLLLLVSGFGHPILMVILAVPVFLTFLLSWYHEDDGTGPISALINFSPLLATVYGPLSACNLIPKVLFKLFPNWLIKPDKGPKWEFNRRTGLVTVYHYDRRGVWGRSGEPDEEVAPFYEFDACLTQEVIYPGGTVHTLYLVNRYHPIVLAVGELIGKTTPEECYALWDMLQNFMDTSRPLPDIPLWEEHRPHDPVTAEHDRRTRRPPCYWRDMDKATWQRHNEAMGLEVLRLGTPARPDIMRRSWSYQPRHRPRHA